MRTTISLVGVVLLALLVSGCPGGKKKNSAQEACAKISNTVMIGNECQCLSGYTKIASSGGGSYDFQCQHSQTCRGNATLINGTCQCSNGKPYNSSNMSSPCGEVVSDGRLGLTAEVLQSKCGTIGQWQNGFCSCVNGQQFNALTGQCEPLLWHHTQAMCGAGATFYGQGGRGVCVCQNPQALFHPSFGGCSTRMDTPVIDFMCKNLYSVETGYAGGRCACPQGRVWFRGSCLDLGNDFVTQVPSLPPELHCELGGGRMIDGNCQPFVGGYIGHGHRTKPIICRRDSLEINRGKETIEMWSDRVRVTVEGPGLTPLAQEYHPQEYFRIRCEDYAFSPGSVRYWAKGIGKYNRSSPPYFGECFCGAGYTTTFDRYLGYSYCVATGHQMYAPQRCDPATLCGSGISLNIGANRSVSASVELCTPGGKNIQFGIR